MKIIIDNKEIEIPEDIKQQWVLALRSGKYEQGRCRLRSVNNKFCCLGVLLDLIDNSLWILVNNQKYGWSSEDCFGAALHPTVASALKMTKGGDYILDGEKEWLANDNDTKQLSFVEIADIIEVAQFVPEV